VSTLDALEQILEPWFDPFVIEGEEDAGLNNTSFNVPMIIRETERKHQFTFSDCSIWIKKGA
jgi:hypothetical protein